jgi:hypothetical protein
VQKEGVTGKGLVVKGGSNLHDAPEQHLKSTKTTCDPARHLKTSKRQKGNKKGKGGGEPTIVIVVFQIMTIVGESSQKLNKKGKTFSRCGFYLEISNNDKSI